MLLPTPSKKFLQNLKGELSGIASASKRNPHLGSPQCMNSLKRMQKLVSGSSLKESDKRQINSRIEWIERSLSPQKQGNRKLSSTQQRSDRTHRKHSSAKKSKKESGDFGRLSSESIPFEIRELQMRNQMLEDQIRSYKSKVKEARRLMIKELKDDQQTLNLDYVEFDHTKRQIKESNKEMREIMRENQQLKEALEEKQERVYELTQQNRVLKRKLAGKERMESQGGRVEQESQREDEVQRLKKQIKRLKIQKASVDKKSTLLSSNEKLREIVHRYKSYM